MEPDINALADLLEQAAALLRKIAKKSGKVWLDAEMVGLVIAGKAKHDNPAASEGPFQMKP